MFRKLRQLLDVLNGTDTLIRSKALENAAHAAHAAYRAADLARRDPLSLVPHGWRVHSQYDEDGILAEILRRIGHTGPGTAIEFGCGDGRENNTVYLLRQGWRCWWAEGDPDAAARLRSTFARPLKEGRLAFAETFLTAEDVAGVFGELGAPTEPTVLSIDTDGNDYHLWKALAAGGFWPRVVSVEYNAALGPSLDWVMPYDPAHRFPATRWYGASLDALRQLGNELGYIFAGCNWYGTNAFFARHDLPGEFPGAAWEPARHPYCRPLPDWPVDPREFA